MPITMLMVDPSRQSISFIDTPPLGAVVFKDQKLVILKTIGERGSFMVAGVGMFDRPCVIKTEEPLKEVLPRITFFDTCEEPNDSVPDAAGQVTLARC